MLRCDLRESVHYGAVALHSADGSVRGVGGDISRPILPRSANKPIQALAMVRAGLELADADLAVVCASHNGEPAHVEHVQGILAGAGLTEEHLRCPPDLPLHQPSAQAVLAAGGGPRRIFMNCSGKHAGMLATCRAGRWSLPDYRKPEHPLQVRIAATVAELTGEPVAGVAVDGCGAPLFSVSLAGLARAFARLVTAAPGTAARRVADAMRAHPFLVAGTGREDTRLMSAVPGLVCKSGAEGVQAAALPDGRAVAIKIADGAGRARLPVTVAALRALGVREPGLDELAEEPVLGGGVVVGRVRLIPGALAASQGLCDEA